MAVVAVVAVVVVVLFVALVARILTVAKADPSAWGGTKSQDARLAADALRRQRNERDLQERLTEKSSDPIREHVHATLSGFANKHPDHFASWLQDNADVTDIGYVSVGGWCTVHECPTIPRDWDYEGGGVFGEECWRAVWTDAEGSCSSKFGAAAVYRKAAI